MTMRSVLPDEMGRSNSPQRERFDLMKCMTCDTPDLSEDEFDIHARVFHSQMSGDELQKMFKELSEELAPDMTKFRKTR